MLLILMIEKLVTRIKSSFDPCGQVITEVVARLTGLFAVLVSDFLSESSLCGAAANHYAFGHKPEDVTSTDERKKLNAGYRRISVCHHLSDEAFQTEDAPDTASNFTEPLSRNFLRSSAQTMCPSSSGNASNNASASELL